MRQFNTTPCLTMLSLLHVITYLELNVCLISPFEARACRDNIFLLIEIYLLEYTERTINIIQVLILQVIGVNLSKISNFLINFTNRLIFI